MVTPTNISTYAVTSDNIGDYAVTPDNIQAYLSAFTDSTTVSTIASDIVTSELASLEVAPNVSTGSNQALTYDGTTWSTVSLLSAPDVTEETGEILDWDDSNSKWTRR